MILCSSSSLFLGIFALLFSNSYHSTFRYFLFCFTHPFSEAFFSNLTLGNLNHKFLCFMLLLFVIFYLPSFYCCSHWSKEMCITMFLTTLFVFHQNRNKHKMRVCLHKHFHGTYTVKFRVLYSGLVFWVSADCECLHYAKHFLPSQTRRDQSMSIPIPSANQCHFLSPKTGSNRKTLFLKPCMLNQWGQNVTLYHKTSRIISVKHQGMKVNVMTQQNKT